MLYNYVVVIGTPLLLHNSVGILTSLTMEIWYKEIESYRKNICVVEELLKS